MATSSRLDGTSPAACELLHGLPRKYLEVNTDKHTVEPLAKRLRVDGVMWPDRRYDVAGVYSGNTFIDDDGFPCALYTGNVAGHAEAYGVLARSIDGWLTWHKHRVMDNEQRPNAASPVH